jgi:hypothetical protein
MRDFNRIVSEDNLAKLERLVGKTAVDHVLFLEGSLIPDLKDSGTEATAEDFETCLLLIDQLVTKAGVK